MSSPVQISEAASIAIHTVLLLAQTPEKLWSNQEISRTFGFSKAHAAKVFQALARSGIIASVRGPGGGSRLAKPASGLTLLDVYEAVEGPLETQRCLLDTHVCRGDHCSLGHGIYQANQAIRKLLAATVLSKVPLQTDFGHRPVTKTKKTVKGK